MALQDHFNIIDFSYLSDMILYLGFTALQDDFKIAEESYISTSLLICSFFSTSRKTDKPGKTTF